MSPLSNPRVAGALFCALAFAAAAPANAAIVTFTGIESNDTPTPHPDPACAIGTVLVSFNPSNSTAAGTSNFGAFGPSMTHCLTKPSTTTPTSYSGGVFEFDFTGAGDEFSGTYSGVLTPINGTNVFDSTVDYVVTGGTGRFLGASGTFEGVGTLDRTFKRPLNSLTLDGRLNLPAVPEPSSWALMLGGFFGMGATLRRLRAAALTA